MGEPRTGGPGRGPVGLDGSSDRCPARSGTVARDDWPVWWTRAMGTTAALDAVRRRAELGRAEAIERWAAVVGAGDARALGRGPDGFAAAGRVTLNFHPDRITRSGTTVAAGLLADGRYRSQWVTGISNGSRSAFAGGDRHGFEQALFGDAYEGSDPAAAELPVYGALDLLGDPHGGSPRFGSCFVVLRAPVLTRTTLCVGDSHIGPRDVGTVDAPWCVLAGLAEQSAATTLLDRPLGVGDLVALLGGDPPTASIRRSAAIRTLDGYVEAQVHGGVDLASDVEAIVVDPSFAGTDVERDLALAADRHGFELRRNPGSELAIDDVPADFRRPSMPALAAGSPAPTGSSTPSPSARRRRDRSRTRLEAATRRTRCSSSSSTCGTPSTRSATTPVRHPVRRRTSGRGPPNPSGRGMPTGVPGTRRVVGSRWRSGRLVGVLRTRRVGGCPRGCREPVGSWGPGGGAGVP